MENVIVNMREKGGKKKPSAELLQREAAKPVL